ncbi:MAG: hypothetical protein A3H96_04095 [Acidobacteria bacterium RIFCSPLOWO2_02_FULL_67_36]|nr:MAG: hypothetical protein A3H96_04095 [Acidobacteria bacterium RIFCSPLOWO2_02_FULL_67_36]OFW19692.1 MAG: hypothetical protein A3G21_12980 [Acidobacteria bacterium RIFCSPLOWO2_12_FULL_66_21]
MPLLLGCSLILSLAGGSAAPPDRPAVLVELFTSEGCSSCPPADRFLARLLATQPVEGVEVIPIELHVDYWDRLGWKDPFSSAAFTRRQGRYSGVFGQDRIYTPQMVVDGHAEMVGSDESAALAAIRKAGAAAHLPLSVSTVVRDGILRLSVHAPPLPARTDPVDVVAAVVEDRLSSSVRGGENNGRSLTHSAVVRRLESMGSLEKDGVSGERQWRLDPAWQPGNLRVVVFLQGRKSLRIYGAATSTPSSN